MSNFSALKTAIQNAIKQNGNEEITGNVLQNILISVVETLGDSAINTLETDLSDEATTRGDADTQLNNLITGIKNNIDNGYVYAGIATPSTTPVSGKVFYIATQAGTYTNLGNTAVKSGISILKYNGSAWSNEQVIYTDGGVFDVSAYNGGATYASLEALLGDANLSTIIPSAVRKGGMSIKFVLTSDNKYVQYRLMSDTFNTTVANWQGIDTEIKAESKNLVESGAVAKENSNFLRKKTLGNNFHPIKNLININELLYGKQISSGNWTDAEGGITSNKIKFEDGVTYAMQGIGCYGSPKSIYIAYFDSSDDYLGRTSHEATLDDVSVNRGKAIFTFSNQSFENVAYCRVVLQTHTTAPIDTSLCQIEVGGQYTAVVGYDEVGELDYVSHEEFEIYNDRTRNQYPRGFVIDYNHVYSIIDAENNHYTENENYDSVLIAININFKTIVIENCTPTRYVFFSSPELITANYIGNNTTGNIISGAKYCCVNMKKSDNPNGYDKILIRFPDSIPTIQYIDDSIVTGILTFESKIKNQYPRGYYIGNDHLMSISSGSAKYNQNSAWDCVVIILSGQKFITLDDVVITTSNKYRFFNSLNIFTGQNVYDNYIVSNSTGKVPSDAKVCICNVKKSDNPNGYDIRLINDYGLGKAEKKKIRLLSIGNSYSQDALAYVPFILRNMGVDIDVQIGIAMQSSSTLEDHVDNFENETSAYTYFLYDGGDSWSSKSSKSIQYILDDKIWDIISLQQSSSKVFTWSTYQPYLNQLINLISGHIEYQVKFGWYAVQSRPAKTNGGENWSDETITSHYEAISDNAAKVIDETICEFLVPVNTAIQNARTVATIKALGAYANNSNNASGIGYLTPNDGVHLQEGLPCQIAAYTFVLSLLKLYGFDNYSIMGETTRVTSEWATGKGIPGPHGDYIGSTDENCLIAQASAIMAVKHPYEVTDMNYIVNPT